MAATSARPNPITITDLSGGRNGYDFPLYIPDNQCREALNMEFWQTPLGTKRWGTTALAVTFSAGGPFGGAIGSLHRFVPGADETAAELWAIDRSSTSRFGRLAGATTWVQATLTANLAAATDADNVTSAYLNGFLYFCYKSGATNRSFVWDPLLSKVRQTGISTPTAPTASAGAAGALAFTRSYRTRYIDVSGSDIRRRSEASLPVTFTIAANVGIDVARFAGAAGEDETHWEVEAAATTAGPWYRIATVAFGTALYSDNSATIPTDNPTAVDGINRPPPSAQYIIATDSRLIMAGRQSNVTTDLYVKSRINGVYVTPVIGDNDIGDSERIPLGLTYTVDAPVTGLAGPLDGAFYVFSYRRIWKFVPTGNPADPYARYSISASVGCIRHQSIVMAEDEHGNPAIYFLSVRGPYRLGSSGLQFLGTDVSDIWATVNLAGTSHAVYYGDKQQIWFYVTTAGANAFTDTKLKFSITAGRPDDEGQVRQGWSVDTGNSAITYASVMFAASVGASMGRALVPYVAQNATGAIWKCDDATVVQDTGTSYDSYVDTKEYAPAGLLYNVKVDYPSVVLATPRASQAESFGVVLGGDFYFDNATQTPSLIASKTLTIPSAAFANAPVHVKVEGVELAGLGSFALRLGNLAVAAGTSSFSIYGVSVPWTQQEAR